MSFNTVYLKNRKKILILSFIVIKYNLMLERPENRYRIGDPFGAEDFTMLLGDERGARAYLYYQTDRDGGNVLHVRDIAFTDAEGFRMCKAYLKGTTRRLLP